MITSLKCARITQESPRIVVTMSWGADIPEGEFRLYVRRYGENEDFAYYPAIDIAGGEITFQLDNLLFDKGVGRYEGRLIINTEVYATLQIDYRNSNTLVSVENPNV